MFWHGSQMYRRLSDEVRSAGASREYAGVSRHAGPTLACNARRAGALQGIPYPHCCGDPLFAGTSSVMSSVGGKSGSRGRERRRAVRVPISVITAVGRGTSCEPASRG